MKVLIMPYFNRNPYQNLLAKALSKHGIKIEFENDFRLVKILNVMTGNRRPDILHIHWIYPYMMEKNKYKSILLSNLFILKLIMLKALGIKIIWTVHNTLNHERQFISIDLFYRKLLARVSNKIIAHGEQAKSEIMELYGLSKNSRVSIVHHGNYLDVYQNKISKIEARKRLKIDGKSRVLLYFGYIRQYKGIPELLNVFKRLKESNVILLIIGNPKNKEVVELLKKECQNIKNVKLHLEYIHDDDIQIYMNAADFVVLPFKSILSSGSMMLALSFGKPIVAPDLGHINEILDKKGNIVYDPNEKGALFKSVQTCLMYTDKKIEQMGENNLKIAKKYDWDNIGDCTYKIYQTTLKKT